MITRLRCIHPANYFVAGVVATLVLTGGGVAAYAANGGTIRIGQANSGTRVTTLSNSAGTALKLNSKAGTAPLAVNRTNKVTNLNADMVDGITEGSLARAAGQTGVISAQAEFIDTDEDAVDDALIAIADCPAGTKLTGGGHENFTAEGFTLVDAPDENGWVVISTAGPGVDALDSVIAHAVCYNPRGAVPGAGAPARATSDISASVKEKAVRATARLANR
jgi:hypothetical protein